MVTLDASEVSEPSRVAVVGCSSSPLVGVGRIVVLSSVGEASCLLTRPVSPASAWLRQAAVRQRTAHIRNHHFRCISNSLIVCNARTPGIQAIGEVKSVITGGVVLLSFNWHHSSNV